VIYPGSEEPDRLRDLTDEYRAAGGSGPAICIKSVWVGHGGPRDPGGDRTDSMAQAYAAASAPGMRQAGGFPSGPIEGDTDEVVERLVAFVRTAGVDAVNLRCNRAGVATQAVVEQVARVGAQVLPALRSGW
jgi:hypothetical protein